MSDIEITFSNKQTPGQVDDQFKFNGAEDTINGLKYYVQFKLANGKPVELYHDNNLLINDKNKTLKDYGIQYGDNLEYEITTIGGKKRKGKSKKTTRKMKKIRRKTRKY